MDEAEGRVQSRNPDCLDKRDSPEWSCIEFDGTGLWCDSCLAAASSGEESAPARTPSSNDAPERTI